VKVVVPARSFLLSNCPPILNDSIWLCRDGAACQDVPHTGSTNVTASSYITRPKKGTISNNCKLEADDVVEEFWKEEDVLF
jgi:hypothetical protein